MTIFFQAVLVHTSETRRLRYFLDLLMGNRRPVLLVGGAGCGKTVLVNDKLSSLREESLVITIPFNHYTTSLMLQGVMEKPLEKKAGEATRASLHCRRVDIYHDTMFEGRRTLLCTFFYLDSNL